MYLVHDVLLVDGQKEVGFDHRMEVRVHELKHEVDVLVVARLDHVEKFDDVFVRRKRLDRILCMCCV